MSNNNIINEMYLGLICNKRKITNKTKQKIMFNVEYLKMLLLKCKTIEIKLKRIYIVKMSWHTIILQSQRLHTKN